MKIEITDMDDNMITSISSESNPFKVGEKLHLTIKNDNKEFRNVKEIDCSYIIMEIENFVKVLVHNNGIYRESITTIVKVTPLE